MIKTIKTIKNLTQREKVLIGGAAIFIIGLLGYYFVISPALERSRLLSRLIAQKEMQLQELLLLKEEYRTLKASEDEIVSRLSAAGGSVSPLSQLEQLARSAGLRDRIQQMKPLSPISTPRYTVVPVQLRFKGAGLKEVVSYLYEIENASLPFRIKRLKIRSTARSPGSLDVTLEILTFSVSGGR
ncbi:MAG: type II secretion system protein M [Deltaproteobacteria bacterium]|nr:type II secretion system protein M [Deltaproteobacteria bacterium]